MATHIHLLSIVSTWHRTCCHIVCMVLVQYVSAVYFSILFLLQCIFLELISLSSNTAWVRARLCKLQTRLATASDKVYQLLAHGRQFSPASSTTKTCHDIAEILLKVALNTKNQSAKNVVIVWMISIYLCNQYLSPLVLWVKILFRRDALNTTLCDKVSKWLATGHWFSLGTPVSSTNKTDRHNVTEILLKVTKTHVQKTTGKQRINQDEQTFSRRILTVGLSILK